MKFKFSPKIVFHRDSELTAGANIVGVNKTKDWLAPTGQFKSCPQNNNATQTINNREIDAILDS